MIAAGSGYNGCATATDLHRDSLLQNNHYGCQYNKFSCECKCIFKKKTKIFFEKIIRQFRQVFHGERYGNYDPFFL